MPATAFHVESGFPHIAELMGGQLGREDFLQRILHVFTDEMGFDRARYYEKASDMARDAEILVLTAQDPPTESAKHGLAVDFSDSTVAAQRAGQYPAVSHAAAYGSDPPWWVDELDLQDRPWVEVPITAGDQTVGLIGADWIGTPEDVASADLEKLRVVGAQVGSHLGLKPIHLIRRFPSPARTDGATDGSVPAAATSVEAPDDLVKEAAERLGGLLDASATAVFAFSWPHQKLSKVHDYFAEAYRGSARSEGELKETYGVGQHLTGRAWLDPTVRHVVSFESLQRYGTDLVATESRDWHARTFGRPVKSVMYAVLGALDRRYLIRFMNRASRPELPFLVEAEVLDAIAADLRSEVDAAIATQRSRSLEDMARLTAGATSPTELVGQVGEGLAGECVKDFAVICHQDEAAQFGFAEFCGERVADISVPRNARWAEDSLYAGARAKGGHDVRRLTDFTGPEDSPVAIALREAGFASALTIPLSTGQTRGVLIVPMDAPPPATRQRKQKLPDGCTFGTVSLLMAYASLIGNAVETRHSAAKADGARRALGFLGHELRAPLASLGSAAEVSINTAKRTVREANLDDFQRTNYLMARLAEQEKNLYDRQHDVSLALALSPVVAQESEGSLQLHFEPTRMTQIAREAIVEVRTELQLDRNPRRYLFEVADALARMPVVVADPERLRHVLKNLLRNAVNYSMPRKPGRPMQIDIFGEYQTGWIALKVRNWGLGVPEDKRDLIFEPWVRGGIKDTHKAIRGMGLGLYLARRIISGHDGDIFFTSEPTLDDRSRTARLEGFETVFELRVPRDLKPGTYTHEWSGGERTHPPRVDA